MQYRVDGPDGQSYMVEGPEGASDQQVLAALQHHLYPPAPKPVEQPGILKTALHGFERGIAPLAVGAGTGAAIGTAVAPGLGTLGGGIVGLLGAIPAMLGTSKLQEAGLAAAPGFAKAIGQDPETQQAERAAHPIAAEVGENLPAVIPGVGLFRPTMVAFERLAPEIKNLAKSGAAKIVNNEALTAEETAAMNKAAAAAGVRQQVLKQSLINAALTGGLNVGQQALSDQPFDARSALISAATGALGMTPTGLGRKVLGTGETLANKLLGKPSIIQEPVPAAAESATTPTTQVSDTGESAPEAAGPVKGKKKAKAPTTSTGKALRPLDKLVGADSLAGSGEKPELSKPPDTVAESAEKISSQTRPKVTPPTPEDLFDEVTELGDLQPVDTEDPHYQLAREIVKTTGKGDAGLIRSGLRDMGFDLTPREAMDLRQQLIDNGDLKVGGKNGPRKSTPAADTGAVSAGTEPPVPRDDTDRPTAGDVGPGAVDAAGARTVRVNSRKGKNAPALETGPTVVPPEWSAPQGISERIEASPTLPEVKPTAPERVYELGKPKPPKPEPPLSLIDRISALKLSLPDSYQDRLAGMQNRARNAKDPTKLTGIEKEVAALEKLDPHKVFEAEGHPEEIKPNVENDHTEPTGSTSAPLRDAIMKGDMRAVLDHLATPGMDDRVTDPINQELAAQLNELKFESVKINAEGAPGHDEGAIGRLKSEGKLGEYDPKTNTIHLTTEGMNDNTVLHEAVHAATVKMLRRYELNPDRMLPPSQGKNPDTINDRNTQNDALRDAAGHIHKIMAAADKALPPKARLTHRAAFENVYEFVSHAMTNRKFQLELAKLRSRDLNQYTFREMNVAAGKAGEEYVTKNEQGETVRKTARLGKESLWSQFTKAVARLLGIGHKKEGNLLLEASQAISNIMSNPAKVKGVEPLAARKKVQAPPPKDRSTEEIIAQQAKDSPIHAASPKTVFEKVKGMVARTRRLDYEEAVKHLENSQRSVVNLDRQIEMANRANPEGKDYNSLGMALAASTANSKLVYDADAKPLLDTSNKAIQAYADARKISVADALHRVNAYLIGLHEPERRAVMFMLEAPLSKTKRFKTNGGSYLPASRVREDIVEHLYQNKALPPKVIAEFRDQLERLANTDKTKGPVYLDKAGDSPTGKTSIKPEENAYNVAGTYTRQEIANLQKSFNDELATHPELDAVMKAVDAVQKKTIDINRRVNYWTTPVDNIVNLYGYKHYIPLKGNPNAKTNTYDYVDKRLGGSFSEYEKKAEGRQTDADNSVIQTLTDLARAAARTGRSPVTKAFVNLMKDPVTGKINRSGIIDGELKRHVTFDERIKDSGELEKLQKQRHFFEYLPDGSFNVYKVHGQQSIDYLEAVKGEIKDREGALHKMADIVRPVTTGMAKMHTLWNVAFAPYNEARHLITNSLKISSKYGVGTLPTYWRDALSNNLRGKFFTAWKYFHLYNNGDLSQLQAAAKAKGPGSFESNLYEYLSNAGNTEQMHALSNKGLTADMLKGSSKVGNNIMQRSARGVMDILKLWTHSFELTNRATSYGILKDAIMKDLKSRGYKGDIEKAAQARAAGETKDLLNFQNVGLWGRDLSAIFEFYRANVTGAVAALDAVRPAFISADSYLKMMPDRIKYSTETMKAIKDVIKAAKKDPALAATRDADIARLQAADKTADTIRANYGRIQHNARMTMAFTAGIGMLMYQMAKMMAGNDEQGRNIVETDDMGQWVRNMRFPAQWLGTNAKNSFIQMPWGYGVGALGAVGAQIAGATSGHTPLRDTIWNIINPLRESFFPVPTAEFNPFTNAQTGLKFIVDSGTPTAFRPLVEAALNVDTFGREVIPTHINKYGDVYSGGEAVPEMYKEATRWWMEHTGLEINPATVQFVVSNYIDGVARFMQDATSDAQVAMGTGYWDPKRSLVTMPASNFIGKQSSVDAREFADKEQEVERMQKTINMLKNTGHMDLLADYIDKHQDAMPMVLVYNREINGGIKKLRGMIAMVQASDMPAKDKHDILNDLNQNLHLMQRGFLDISDQLNNRD